MTTQVLPYCSKNVYLCYRIPTTWISNPVIDREGEEKKIQTTGQAVLEKRKPWRRAVDACFTYRRYQR
jgi:hypothetical protein